MQHNVSSILTTFSIVDLFSGKAPSLSYQQIPITINSTIFSAVIVKFNVSARVINTSSLYHRVSPSWLDLFERQRLVDDVTRTMLQYCRWL